MRVGADVYWNLGVFVTACLPAVKAKSYREKICDIIDWCSECTYYLWIDIYYSIGFDS